MKELAIFTVSVCAALAACGSTNTEPTGKADEAEPVSTASATASTHAASTGNSWHLSKNDTRAQFGKAIVLRCASDAAGDPHLSFAWTLGPAAGSVDTVTMAWAGDAETFAVHSDGKDWSGAFYPVDAPANFLLAATGPITISLGGHGKRSITVPADENLKTVIRNCQP